MSVFEKLKEKWSGKFISRADLSTLTGGVLKRSSFKNWEQAGNEVNGRTIIGGRVYYPIDGLIAWLEKNVIIERRKDRKSLGEQG